MKDERNTYGPEAAQVAKSGRNTQPHSNTPLRQLWFSRKKNLTILENKNLEGNPPKSAIDVENPLMEGNSHVFHFSEAEKRIIVS